MSAPIPLRQDFDATQLRGLAKKTKDGPQARRHLALAAIYDGAMRTEAAKIGGVGLQIIRDWVIWFNADGADGLRNGKSPGQPSKLNDAQRLAIARITWISGAAGSIRTTETPWTESSILSPGGNRADSRWIPSRWNRTISSGT